MDIEGLVVRVLQPVAPGNVGTELPADDDRTYPLIQVRLEGRSTTTTWGQAGGFGLSEVTISLDVYGTTNTNALATAEAALAALAALGGPEPEACVVGWTTDSLAYDPDPDVVDQAGHARPRYVAEGTLICHP